jgi:glycosyltransferase involved in cell wall biosynthesis
MRILLVVYGRLEQLSGGYLYDRQVVGYLRSQGVQVEILSLPACPYLLCPLRLPRAAAPERELRRVLRGAGKPPFDAVLIDELVHASVFRYLKPPGRTPPGPVVVTLVHHLKSQEPIPAFLRAAARAMERRLLARSHGILVNSVVTGQTVRELVGGAIPLYLCPPGSDLLPELGAGDARGEAPGAADGAVRLLATGNLIPRKGYDLLLRVLGDLGDLHWRLRVVGRIVDRAYRRRLDRLARRLRLEGRVQFTGELRGEDLAQEYRQADVFVFPSRYEGYGISLAEAVRAGLPFVAFASGAVAEVTGGRGLLLPPGDLRGFGGALAGLIRDREARRQAARLSREVRAQLPGWADTGRRVYEALQEVLKA